MGTSASNSLDLSVSDPSGYEYKIKFDAESFAEGKHRSCYIGTLSNDKAPKNNKKVVLKVFKSEYVNKYNFEYECVKDLERSITCHELSIQFNKSMEEFQSNGNSFPISFPAPLRINIKRGKDIKNNINLTNKLISKVFNNIPIHISNHKYLTVQSYLKNKNKNTNNKYIKMSSNNGWFNSDIQKYDFLAAFSHFSWAHTKGKSLICGFQGIQRNNVLFLNDSILHSNTIGSNGNNDLGIIGIINFFLNHKCNECCRNLPVLNVTLLLNYLNKDSILTINKSTTYLNELNKADLVSDENNIKYIYEQSINDTFSGNIQSEAEPCEAGVESHTETIDKMEQIESIICANNGINTIEESNTVVIEEELEMNEFIERVNEREGNIYTNESDIESESDEEYLNNNSSISNIDFDNESLQQININTNMNTNINTNMNNSWFVSNDTLNEYYNQQNEYKYANNSSNNSNNNSANDEWEFI